MLRRSVQVYVRKGVSSLKMDCEKFQPGVLRTLMEYLPYQRQTLGGQALLRYAYRHALSCDACALKYYDKGLHDLEFITSEFGLSIAEENERLIERMLKQPRSVFVRKVREVYDAMVVMLL